MKINLAVIFGGKSVEHDISVITGVSVIKNINKRFYNVFPVYLKGGSMYTGNGLLYINSYRNFLPQNYTETALIKGKFYSVKGKKLKELFYPDAVLLCTHGGEGENGCLQGLLEMNNLAYTSSGVTASAVTMDKIKMKELFVAGGFDTLPFIKLSKGEPNKEEKVASELGYPVVVKPSHLGSSIGISVAHNKEQLAEALELAFTFDEYVLIERALIKFYEYNQAALNDKLSAIERPYPKDEILSFKDKYVNSSGRELPAKISEDIRSEICSLTKRLYSHFNLNGIVRVDYIFDKVENKLYPLEINTIPGSLSLYLYESLGEKSENVLDELIFDAIKRKKEKDSFVTVFDSSVLSSVKEDGGKYLKK